MANWSELPEEIIDLVAKRLPPYPNEFAQFSCVCKSWNSVLKKQNSNIIRCAPWLMLARSKNDKQFKKGSIRSFYCHSTKRLFNYYLPQAKRTRCWGTPYGWLLTFDLDRNIHLLHPLSRVQISLPSQTTFEHQWKGPCTPEVYCQTFVTRFALASNPSIHESGQCPLVMAIYGDICRLAVASPGDKAWTSVECSTSNYEDIIFFNGHFYAISCDGILRIIEVNTRQPKAKDFASPPDNIYVCSTFYLVEFSGDLCMVERAFKGIDADTPSYDYHNETTYFVVHKFDFYSKTWTEVEDLGDHALFLGNNTSFAVSTSDYPEFRGNCIYFTDDHADFYEKKFCDMGIYDIKHDMVESFYFDDHQLSKFSRPVFFMPTL
ncbi:hypothetical protein AQUCO_09600040v1 [Aquilegia coerulea]|uniref:F-box domain-containing protein n=1 Tax=Aquilegia coerulea TaxID=218851 RepID=A0A2G5C4K0_AQUCA|nr:hypothetical protein AQUCO_09600040v1 [Aquilegia coerulea]